jgi:hypothetical protein
LPPAPTKKSDSRGEKWDGLGQVELDAVLPETIAELCVDAIESCFVESLYEELLELQESEKTEYKSQMREKIIQMFN